MDKLIERDDAPRASPLATAPALAVQFFLIPLAVVAVVVFVYAGFRLLLADERTAQDYLREISTTRGERRWPPAYELSRLMANPNVQADPMLGPALVQAFRDARDDDPRVRRYLALALGRLAAAPPGATAALVEALEDDADAETRITAIWAIGALGDPAAVPALAEASRSDDPGVRKVAVYALGALPGDAQRPALRRALEDREPDVRWNAALALARGGHADGEAVLRQMLDRAYLERVVQPGAGAAGEDPVAEVLISSLRAAAALRAEGLRPPVAALSRDDRDLRVRSAALDALRALDSDQ